MVVLIQPLNRDRSVVHNELKSVFTDGARLCLSISTLIFVVIEIVATVPKHGNDVTRVSVFPDSDGIRPRFRIADLDRNSLTLHRCPRDLSDFAVLGIRDLSFIRADTGAGTRCVTKL